jgi:hypothetical protein
MADETVDTSASADSSQSQPAAAASETATPTPEQNASAVSSESQSSVTEGGDATVTDQTTGQEATGQPVGGQVKKSLEERVEELASRKVAEAEARINAKLTETQQAKAPLDFVPNIDFAKVNNYIKETLTAIEQAQLDGDFVKALDLQEDLRQTREGIKANEGRKAEYMQQQQATEQSEQQIVALNSRIADASALVAKEYKIPEDVWKKGEEFFAAERQSKPLIDAQYREKVMLQGPVAAMMWAKDYVEQNMGKKQQDLINSKEAAKDGLMQGKTATGAVLDDKANKLAEAKKAAQSGNPSDLAVYSRILRESRQ